MDHLTFPPDDDGEDFLGFPFFRELLINSVHVDPIIRMFSIADILYKLQSPRQKLLTVVVPSVAPVPSDLPSKLSSRRAAHYSRYANELLRPASFTCLHQHVSWQTHDALSRLLCLPAFVAVVLVNQAYSDLRFESAQARHIAGSRHNGPARRVRIFKRRYAFSLIFLLLAQIVARHRLF